MTVPSDDFVRKCRLIKVVDGDTLRLEIDLGFGTKLSHDVRLKGVDTPERRGPESPAGKWVTKKVIEFIAGSEEVVIHSKIFKLGKYGRCLCNVWVNGESLNAYLLNQGFGWPTEESGGIVGPRSLDRLQLPDGIRQQCLENLA